VNGRAVQSSQGDTMPGTTWLGPPSEGGAVCLGPVRVERWRRQPFRTLIFGNAHSGKSRGHIGREGHQVVGGPGLVAAVAVSKGHPEGHADSGVVCAGVRLSQLDEQQPARWYCPCDVNITLVGERAEDYTRTIRWVFTPWNSEMFFGILPLADVEKHFISDSGALRVKAELRFHLSVQPGAARTGLLPLGAHGPTLRALMYSWCLAGVCAIENGESMCDAVDKKGCVIQGWTDLCRTGPVMRNDAPPRNPLPPAPGLLPPCPEPPSAFAQEIVPGLILASEQALSKLVELHDVGVGTLLEVGVARPPPTGHDGSRSTGQTGFVVRLLQLRGCGDTVELVEGLDCNFKDVDVAVDNVEPACNLRIRSAGETMELLEGALGDVLAGCENAGCVVVFPREEPRDMEPCAALIAVAIARHFRLSFDKARRYLQTRWDVSFSEAWMELFAGEDARQLLVDQQLGVNSAMATAGLPTIELAETLRNGDPEGRLPSMLASWFAEAAGGSSPVSFGTVLAWEQTWEPLPGASVRVFDSGWGSASEVFRAIVVAGEGVRGPVVTLRMMSALPRGELFEVPHNIEIGEDTWHLLALVCQAAAGDVGNGGAAVDDASSMPCIAFLHGESSSLWMLDSDGLLHEVSRHPLGGCSVPNNWICTSDMSAKAVVYLRNGRAKGIIPAIKIGTNINAAAQVEQARECVAHSKLRVRIVTEKMLQRAEGAFEGGLDVPVSTMLTLSQDSSLDELCGSVHQSLKIPPSRQLLLHLPDRFSDSQRLFPVQSPLRALAGAEGSVTLLLMFLPEPDSVPPVHSATPTPQHLPVLCKYFDRTTLRYLVLGVLLAPPGRSLLQHVSWLRRRIASVAGASAAGCEGPSALACYVEVSPREVVPMRMDWPLCEQQVGFGRAVVFEAAPCGWEPPMLAAKALEGCDGHGSISAAMAQLIRPPPPVGLLGCIVFDSDVRAHRAAKGRGYAGATGESLDAWGLLRRALGELLGVEDGPCPELVSASRGAGSGASVCSSGTVSGAETGSTIVFWLPLRGSMVIAGTIACEICRCFASTGRAALCRGRLARYRPREIVLTAGTAKGGARSVWHALFPACASECFRPLNPGWPTSVQQCCLDASYLPAPLAAALGGMAEVAGSVPVGGEVDFFEVGPETENSGDQRAAADHAEHHAASLLGEEDGRALEDHAPPARRGRRKAPTARKSAGSPEGGAPAPSIPMPAALTADPVLTSTAGLGLAEVVPASGNIGADHRAPLVDKEGRARSASPSPQLPAATTPPEDMAGYALLPPAASPPPLPSISGCVTTDRGGAGVLRSVPLRAGGGGGASGTWGDDVRAEGCLEQCRQFQASSICYEGARCRFAHPAGAQLARQEPCPFRSESRDRCPLRVYCAFSHGDAERQSPPFIRARTGDPSTTASAPSMCAQSPSYCGGSAPGSGGQAEDSTAGQVGRMLNSTMEQFTSLLAEAKALNLVDEIRSVEKQLLSLFLLRGPSLPRPPAPRSTAMSRSSSCDSFLEAEAAGRDVARFVLASTPGEATQPSTPPSLVHTPGARHPPDIRHWPDVRQWPDGRQWPDSEPLEGGSVEISPEASLQLPAAAPALPIVSWHEPMVEASSPLKATWAEEQWLSEPLPPPRGAPRDGHGGGAGAHFVAGREDGERQLMRPSGIRTDRRVIAPHISMPNVGFMWHSSPFNISRTPTIRTPVGHCSPARSPTSFSGYCSPNANLPSGFASPSQRRSQSGYSSPSADSRPTFFVGAVAAQCGLMRRLMSLQESQKEKDDDGEWSSDEPAEKEEAEGKNLLDYLLGYAQSVPLTRGPRDPPSLCLNLSSDFLVYTRRGLVPSRTAPCLNAFLQALLPCAPLMHLFAQLSWNTLTKQRAAYACLVQTAFQFFGANAATAATGSGGEASAQASVAMAQASAAMLAPFDAAIYTDPLLRRFERAKAAPPGQGPPTETLALFVRFVIGELHDECKWPVLSPIASQCEDSPISRIFGGLLRKGGNTQSAAVSDFGGLMGIDDSDLEPFLVLHLELTAEPCVSVLEAAHHHLRPSGSSFVRLPPFLLVHLRRFRNVDGVPTRINRHCHIDMRLELEESANCMVRVVSYELCSLVCHYGEAPDSGTYKALARDSCAGGRKSTANDWYVFDDAAVRLKPAEELGAVVQCEGYHVCFLVYRREDTRTINIRPHAA